MKMGFRDTNENGKIEGRVYFDGDSTLICFTGKLGLEIVTKNLGYTKDNKEITKRRVGVKIKGRLRELEDSLIDVKPSVVILVDREQVERIEDGIIEQRGPDIEQYTEKLIDEMEKEYWDKRIRAN